MVAASVTPSVTAAAVHNHLPISPATLIPTPTRTFHREKKGTGVFYHMLGLVSHGVVRHKRLPSPFSAADLSLSESTADTVGWACRSAISQES